VLYRPVSSLVIYKSIGTNKDVYVEHFDIDVSGLPINARPLTEREAAALAGALNTKKGKEKRILETGRHFSFKCIVYQQWQRRISIVLYQSPKVKMFFTEHLEIPTGIAEGAPMLWYASKSSLTVFALASGKRPTEKTKLYHAPFFNVYENGNVCMGTVDVRIKNSASLEELTSAWENYFFNSNFSHLMNKHNPIKGSMANFWKEQVKTGKPFPKKVLVMAAKTIKNLLYED
jgi:PRTRC genetic system protein B